MSKPFDVPLWKKAPFVRLLLPLILGILLQWYLQISVTVSILGLLCFSAAYCLFNLLPLAVKFKLQVLQAIILNLILIAFGLLITWQNNVQNSKNWFGNHYQATDYLIVRIDEQLIQKGKSYKAGGYVEAIIHNDSVKKTKGKVLLYFAKDSLAPPLQYGDKILINKSLQQIKNTGNPGAFNYQRYAAFQSTFHNVFLKQKDWVKLEVKSVNPFKQFIFSSRENILSVLKKNIIAGKAELGIAEALLIGYTNDLDKDLVQAYSNTGVVHIIAISGMHLALIYGLLVWLFARMPIIKKSKILQVILILSCLWLFSLLTGGSASVLRSAVMFTFITIGKNLSKQSSIYNSLAASAFVLLCYNPYFLWDVGFQLSYFAVVSIIVFQKSIYSWIFIQYKWINEIWKLIAISLAAQILTFPICIYYFHQFPNLFLLTNVVAVPLSGVILFAEIGLVAFSWIPLLALYLGKLVGFMVWIMNLVILWVGRLPYSVWENIPATIATTWLLYAVVIGLGMWLLNKNRGALSLAVYFFLGFVLLFLYGNWSAKNKQKIIVYNVPQHQAIDFIEGKNYQFLGDSILLADGGLQNFHLKPARILFQISKSLDTININSQQKIFYQFGNKKVLVIDKSILYEPLQQKIDVDIIVISKNPKLYISQLANVFNCKLYVFDASNSVWKIDQWQKDCSELHLRTYSVPDEGAFVLDL